MIYLIIAGMAIATIIPRIIPAAIIHKMNFRPWVHRALQAIPFAALGALIFPGILSVYEDQPFFGLMGGLVAIVLSFIGLHLIFIVVGAIASVYIMSLTF
ncbi:MAG TPA: AzlD domain-containing protein [Bacillota bacterium]|nr:AzlD domain-containing protein [Bacillota bacterium]